MHRSKIRFGDPGRVDADLDISGVSARLEDGRVEATLTAGGH
jgi:hypothetical protein